MNEQPTSFENQTVEESRRRPVLLYAGVFLFVMAVILVSISMWIIGPSIDESVSGDMPSESVFTDEWFVDADGYLASNVFNVRFTVPEGWSYTTTVTDAQLPKGFEDATLLLENDDLGCAITLADISPSDRGDIYKQVSFADRIFSSHFQFDGSWYLPKDEPNIPDFVRTRERQGLENEVRISASLSIPPFILYTHIGKSPSDVCNADMNALLRTVTYHFAEIELTESMEGVLWHQLVWKPVDGTGMTTEYVLFRVDGYEGAYSIAEYLSTEGREGREMFPKDGVLYGYVNQSVQGEPGGQGRFDSRLVAFDPFVGERHVLPGAHYTDGYIASAFLKGETFYYVLGDSTMARCLDGYTECLGDLYAYNINSGEQTLLLENTLPRIWGYDEAEQALYLRQGWGDAGCLKSQFSRVVNGEEEQLGEFSGCHEGGEELGEELQALYDFRDSLLEKFTDDHTQESAVRVKMGELLSGSVDGSMSDKKYVFEQEL